MITAQTRTPRKRKLRSSCDACGTAKLKCDRGQPECERCISLGQPCVYGISRKMGKPPRNMSKLSNIPPGQANSIKNGSINDISHSDITSAVMGDNVLPGFRSSAATNDASMAWNTGLDRSSSRHASIDAFGAPESDLYGESLMSILSDSPSTELGNILQNHTESKSQSALVSPVLKDTPAPADMVKAFAPLADNFLPLNETSAVQKDNPYHDCSREAYNILGQLSFPDINGTLSVPATGHSSISSVHGTTTNLPIDHVLHVSRTAIQRLSGLVICSCALNPHLAFLYASIISRALQWYHQAATGVKSDFHSKDATMSGGTFESPFPVGSFDGSSSIWSSTAVSTANSWSPASYLSATGSAITPPRISLGSFSIDDEWTETALMVQLLLGELKRTGAVIELFNVQINGAANNLAQRSAFEGLHKSIGMWLGRMQARVVEDVRSLLKDH